MGSIQGFLFCLALLFITGCQQQREPQDVPTDTPVAETQSISNANGSMDARAVSASATYSTISGSGPVVANGVNKSTITISLRSSGNSPISGITPSFTSTNPGSTNVYGPCTVSNSSGISTCTLSSSAVGTRTLSLVSPVAKTGGNVVFVAGPADTTYTTISASGPVPADGKTVSTVSINLRDAKNNPISKVVPTFSASGSNNILSACSSSDANGSSTCSFSSTTAETKNISLLTPVAEAGGSVVFTPSAATQLILSTVPASTISGAALNVSVTAKDINGNIATGYSGTVDFSSNDALAILPAASKLINGTGSFSIVLKTTGSKNFTISDGTLSASSSPITVNPGAATRFILSTSSSSILSGNSITATVTARDAAGNTATTAGNTISITSDDSAAILPAPTKLSNGTAILSITLKTAGSKTITAGDGTLANVSATITVNAGATSSLTSSIAATGPVLADGVSKSTVSIVLKDANYNIVSGITPTFGVSGSNNTLTACTATDANGASTCSFSSTTGETKTINLLTPIAITGGTVTFTTPTLVRDTTKPGFMYVYDYDNAVTGTTAERDAVLNFAKNNKITLIYLSADQFFNSSNSSTNASKQALLTSFISIAKSYYDINVALLFSNYNWALTINQDAALNRTDAAITYLRSLSSSAVKPVAFQYDVEPHALDSWSSNMQSVANQYLDLIEAVSLKTNGVIPTHWTTANFYSGKSITRTGNVTGTGTTQGLSHWIIDLINPADAIVIMNYRDNVPYTKVVSNSGTLSLQTFSNQVLGTSSSHQVTDDIAYATTKRKKVFQAFNTNLKTVANYSVSGVPLTNENCAAVKSLNASAYTTYGSACNSFWDYQASSFGEEGASKLFENGAALHTAYETGSTADTYLAYAGWGVFSYKYFSELKP